MGLNEDLDVLSRTPVFSTMEKEAVRLIAFGAEHMSLDAGKTLYTQGDAADCAYVVASGRLEMWTQFEANEPKSHGQLGEASLLGEIALISQTERQFTVKAVEKTNLLKINRELFHRLIVEYPNITEILKARLEQNLANLTSGIANVGQHIANMPR